MDQGIFSSHQGATVELGKHGKHFLKKNGQLIELVPINLNTPYDVFYSLFRANWMSHKQDGKDFTFDNFCDFLIKYQQFFF